MKSFDEWPWSPLYRMVKSVNKQKWIFDFVEKRFEVLRNRRRYQKADIFIFFLIFSRLWLYGIFVTFHECLQTPTLKNSNYIKIHRCDCYNYWNFQQTLDFRMESEGPLFSLFDRSERKMRVSLQLIVLFPLLKIVRQDIIVSHK